MKRLLIALLIAVSVPVMAQTDELKKLPGYVDFGSLASVYGEPKVEINIGPSMLGFVGALSKHDDPETAELLKGLKGVRVLVYKVGDDPSAANTRIDDIAAKLKTSDWEQIVKVNDDGERAKIFVKMGATTMDGLIVLATDDDDEAVFVNILGRIDPENISKVTQAFHVDVDSLDHKRHKQDKQETKGKKSNQDEAL